MRLRIQRAILRRLLGIYAYFVLGKWVHCYGFFKVLRPENVTVGEDCHISYGVFILGHSRVEIGNSVTISAGAMIIDAGLNQQSLMREHFDSHIVIEDNAWVGAGAIILPGVTIGRGSVIGAGSVVTKSIPQNCVAVGNPARVIKHLKMVNDPITNA